MRVSELRKRLLRVGAGGAVAGGIGAGQAADAAVVFQDFSPPVTVPDPEFFVDLGNDGVDEFRFGLAIDGDFNDLGVKVDSFAGTTFDDPDTGETVTRPGMAGVIMSPDTNFAANLAPDTLIGPSDDFVTPPILTRVNGDTNATDFEPAGNFNGVSGFIGVQFELNGGTHYGYVGYEGEAGLGADGEIFKIGWEDTPDLGIRAGAEESIPIPGDFDNNSIVDGADLTRWESSFGVDDGADADGDGDSDGTDFLAWQRNFAPAPAAAMAVPEPSSLGLLAAGAAGLPLYRRRRVSEG